MDQLNPTLSICYHSPSIKLINIIRAIIKLFFLIDGAGMIITPQLGERIQISEAGLKQVQDDPKKYLLPKKQKEIKNVPLSQSIGLNSLLCVITHLALVFELFSHPDCFIYTLFFTFCHLTPHLPNRSKHKSQIFALNTSKTLPHTAYSPI